MKGKLGLAALRLKENFLDQSLVFFFSLFPILSYFVLLISKVTKEVCPFVLISAELVTPKPPLEEHQAT